MEIYFDNLETKIKEKKSEKERQNSMRGEKGVCWELQRLCKALGHCVKRSNEPEILFRLAHSCEITSSILLNSLLLINYYIQQVQYI